MEYNLKLNNDSTKVQVETGEDDKMTVELDEKKLNASFSRVSDHHIHLDINDGNGNRGFNVFVANGTDGKIIMINGQIYNIHDEDALAANHSRKKGKTNLPDTVTPPMPAVVISVMVEEGDNVEKGQGVVVVSAMKMETTLASPYNGKVTGINTAEGDKVAPGDILVDIEKEESE